MANWAARIEVNAVLAPAGARSTRNRSRAGESAEPDRPRFNLAITFNFKFRLLKQLI